MKRGELGIGHDETFTWLVSFKVIKNWHNAFPWQKRKAVEFASPRLGLFSSVLTIAFHVYWAVTSSCSENFQRGGSIVVFISAIMFAYSNWHDSKGGRLDGGPVEKFEFWNPNLLMPIIAGVGTLIWGYGDLVPLFGNCGR